jgi:hypothetical protein
MCSPTFASSVAARMRLVPVRELERWLEANAVRVLE